MNQKELLNLTKPSAFAKSTKSGIGCDNPRENIDPHIKTQVISTKFINVQNLSGANLEYNTMTGGALICSNVKASDTITGARIVSTSTISGASLSTTGGAVILGSLGIGVTPTDKLDILGHAIILGGNASSWTARTNNTEKTGFIAGPHYTNAEEAVCGFYLDSWSAGNALIMGGGTGAYNAMTEVDFYCGATTTTTSGTLSAQIKIGSFETFGKISGATLFASNGFTGIGNYTTFTISGGIIVAAS